VIRTRLPLAAIFAEFDRGWGREPGETAVGMETDPTSGES